MTQQTGALKELIAERFAGALPKSKFQLSRPSIGLAKDESGRVAPSVPAKHCFMKDGVSLAQYNVADGDTLELKLKARWAKGKGISAV